MPSRAKMNENIYTVEGKDVQSLLNLMIKEPYLICLFRHYVYSRSARVFIMNSYDRYDSSIKGTGLLHITFSKGTPSLRLTVEYRLIRQRGKRPVQISVNLRGTPSVFLHLRKRVKFFGYDNNDEPTSDRAFFSYTCDYSEMPAEIKDALNQWLLLELK